MAPPEGSSPHSTDVELYMHPEDHPPLFANLVTVQINDEEFLLTVAFLQPEGGNPIKGSVLGRFVVSPAHAKRIARTLTEQVARHEALFGSMDHDTDLKQILERSH